MFDRLDQDRAKRLSDQIAAMANDLAAMRREIAEKRADPLVDALKIMTAALASRSAAPFQTCGPP